METSLSAVVEPLLAPRLRSKNKSPGGQLAEAPPKLDHNGAPQKEKQHESPTTKRKPQNGLPWQVETWAKTCGPIPGGLILTHIHVAWNKNQGNQKGNRKGKTARGAPYWFQLPSSWRVGAYFGLVALGSGLPIYPLQESGIQIPKPEIQATNDLMVT